jgi:hypothetical protein
MRPITIFIFSWCFWCCKLSLCLIRHGILKTFKGSGDKAPRILNRGTLSRWVVSVTPRAFAVVKWIPNAQWIESYIGCSAGVNAEEKKEVLCPCRTSIPVPPVVTTGLPTEFFPAYLMTRYLLIFVGIYQGKYERNTAITIHRNCSWRSVSRSLHNIDTRLSCFTFWRPKFGIYFLLVMYWTVQHLDNWRIKYN